jgi:antitoxin (DNA-binding transcriptional repressor) of toxin-antitoxin stability system
VVLRNDHSGALTDIQPGNHVTVTYETLHGKPVAREIAQTSATFAGTLTVIDLQNRMLKAKAALTTKTFRVGDDCAIVLDGKMDGQLSDLKPNEKLAFSYDEINGVNIVNRIATLPTPQTAPTSAQPMYP